ncbi:diguanylate cyclase [Pseudoalteromonas sp. APC 4017]|nr:diguanylate cyclase [Pseudoalteromonas sp. APC 4017]MDN3389151.1 diguanylate cyclase [Pseudoalteromonas sp. APC 4017]
MFFFLIFSTNLLANDVSEMINRVYHGHTTTIESKTILNTLEAGMPYDNSVDNARVMAFKCWFLETDTAQKRYTFKSFFTQATQVVNRSGSKVLQYSLNVCEGSQLYNQGLYTQTIAKLSPIAELALTPQPRSHEMYSVIGLANKVLNRVYVAQGRYKLAFAAAQQSYQAYYLAENPYERALSLREIADIHLALYNYDLAIEQFQRAKSELAVFNVQEQYKITDEIAYAYEQKGDINKAIPLYLSIFDPVRKFEDDDAFAYLVIKVAELYTQLSEFDKAKLYFNQAKQLSFSSEWIMQLHALAHGEWFLATGDLAAAKRENEMLTQFERLQTRPMGFTKRYLAFLSQLSAQLGNYKQQVDAQDQLLRIVNGQVKSVADRVLLSERLMFNFNQQNREIARLEEVAEIKGELLDLALDKSFWQRTALAFMCALFLFLTVYTYKQVQHKKHFKLLALKDELTGIANRRAILDMKKRAISQGKETGKASSLISIDIDHFKAVNDEYGHDVGDELIKSIVNTLSHSIRSSDQVGRVGGEEFLIVLEQQSLPHAIDVAQRIRRSIELQTHTAKNIKATVSMGVVEVNATETPEEAAKRADLNLYEAKKSGRNTIVA